MKKRHSYFSLFCLIGMVAGCGSHPQVGGSKLSVKLAGQRNLPSRTLGSTSLPANAASFDCYLVNVIAADIGSQNENIAPSSNLKNALTGSACTYPGVLSNPMVLSAGNLEANLNIPIGTERLIQVIGVMDSGGSCANLSAATFDKDSGDALKLFEIGRTKLDITGSQTISIPSNYNAARPKGVDCEDSKLANRQVIGKWTLPCSTTHFVQGTQVPTVASDRAAVEFSDSTMTVVYEVFTDSLCQVPHSKFVHSNVAYSLKPLGTGQDFSLKQIFNSTELTVYNSAAGNEYYSRCQQGIAPLDSLLNISSGQLPKTVTTKDVITTNLNEAGYCIPNAVGGSFSNIQLTVNDGFDYFTSLALVNDVLYSKVRSLIGHQLVTDAGRFDKATDRDPSVAWTR